MFLPIASFALVVVLHYIEAADWVGCPMNQEEQRISHIDEIRSSAGIILAELARPEQLRPEVSCRRCSI